MERRRKRGVYLQLVEVSAMKLRMFASQLSVHLSLRSSEILSVSRGKCSHKQRLAHGKHVLAESAKV